MARVRVKHKIGGIRALLRSQPVQARVAREAKRMADAAGEGFEWNVTPRDKYSRAQVRTANADARRRQAKDHVLERVVGGRA